jgi:hypothetical protein
LRHPGTVGFLQALVFFALPDERIEVRRLSIER